MHAASGEYSTGKPAFGASPEPTLLAVGETSKPVTDGSLLLARDSAASLASPPFSQDKGSGFGFGGGGSPGLGLAGQLALDDKAPTSIVQGLFAKAAKGVGSFLGGKGGLAGVAQGLGSGQVGSALSFDPSTLEAQRDVSTQEEEEVDGNYKPAVTELPPLVENKSGEEDEFQVFHDFFVCLFLQLGGILVNA